MKAFAALLPLQGSLLKVGSCESNCQPGLGPRSTFFSFLRDISLMGYNKLLEEIVRDMGARGVSCKCSELGAGWSGSAEDQLQEHGVSYMIAISSKSSPANVVCPSNWSSLVESISIRNINSKDLCLKWFCQPIIIAIGSSPFQDRQEV